MVLTADVISQISMEESLTTKTGRAEQQKKTNPSLLEVVYCQRYPHSSSSCFVRAAVAALPCLHACTLAHLPASKITFVAKVLWTNPLAQLVEEKCTNSYRVVA